MLNDDFIKLILVLILGLNCLFVGYILGLGKGKLYNCSQGSNTAPGSFFDHNKTTTQPSSKIQIDEKKIVGDINTDHLEKKYNSLGETKISREDISNSINKLKNMKG